MLDPGTRVQTELVHARFVATPLIPLQDHLRRVDAGPQLVDAVPAASAMVALRCRWAT